MCSVCPCAPACPVRVPCVSRLPPVSFYRYTVPVPERTAHYGYGRIPIRIRDKKRARARRSLALGTAMLLCTTMLVHGWLHAATFQPSHSVRRSPLASMQESITSASPPLPRGSMLLKGSKVPAKLREWGMDDELWAQVDNKRNLIKMINRNEEDFARKRIIKLRQMMQETATASAPAAGAVATAPKRIDIVDTAVGAGAFKTFASALGAAGLVDTMKSAGPFTVFAPTDAAFAKLPADTVEELFKPENKAKLASILTYHVVSGMVMASTVFTTDGKKVATVNGAEITVKVGKDGVMVDGAKVTTTDIECTNGVIHIIDSVILPPAAERSDEIEIEIEVEVGSAEIGEHTEAMPDAKPEASGGLMQVVCPAELGEGRALRIQLEDGREFDVVVPDGVAEGDPFLVGPFPHA